MCSYDCTVSKIWKLICCFQLIVGKARRDSGPRSILPRSVRTWSRLYVYSAHCHPGHSAAGPPRCSRQEIFPVQVDISVHESVLNCGEKVWNSPCRFVVELFDSRLLLKHVTADGRLLSLFSPSLVFCHLLVRILFSPPSLRLWTCLGVNYDG